MLTLTPLLKVASSLSALDHMKVPLMSNVEMYGVI